MPTFNFTGGSTGAPTTPPTPHDAYGQKDKVRFGGSWATGDTYSMILSATQEGQVQIGAGAITFNSTTHPYNFGSVFKNRIYLANGSTVNYSDNGDPTTWDNLNGDNGASVISYLSHFGSQDTVIGFSQLQGRLAIFGRRSIQLWTVDADPTKFVLNQTLDNIGSLGPLSVQALGDYDVIFLDDTGFRSLRSLQLTLNADIDDIGIPVDQLVQSDLLFGTGSTACAIIEPTSKRYWCFLQGHIYVLSRFRGSKIVAWSQYLTTDNNGNIFSPLKFVVLNGLVYCRSKEGGLLVYGGTSGTTYDDSIVTVELPWLDAKHPEKLKDWLSIDLALAGKWSCSTSMDHETQTAQKELVYTVQSPTGVESSDSTFQLGGGKIAVQQQGTFFKIILTTVSGWTQAATLSEVVIKYNMAGTT